MVQKIKKERLQYCCITAACLESMGLPRTSLEMTSIISLLDEHMLKSFSGRREYVNYSRLAPKIVDSINRHQDNSKTWAEVYGQLWSVNNCVQDGDFNQAKRAYRGLVLSLKDRFIK
jgi:hypothetical protein